MKHPHIFCSLLPLASAVAVVSCADDSLLDPPALVGDSRYISFSPVPVSVSNAITRAGEEKTLYDPLVLNADSEDYPLYLHTYEHPLEDESSSPLTRGVPVESNSDFLAVHGSFSVDAINVTNHARYYGPEETTPVDSSTDTFWTTKTAHRWPANNRLNFSAVAPWSQRNELKNLNFDENTISFSYSAQKGSGQYKDRDAEAQTDLMLASSSFTREEAAKYNHHVPLRFNHALSAVRFAVRDVLEGEVVSIAIKGVFGSGDCSFTADNDGTNGYFDWSNHSNTTSYFQLFDNEHIDGGDFNPNNDENDRELNPTREKTFMLIPQTIPDNAVIELVIKRYNVVSGQPATITVSGNIKKNNVAEWKAGHEYVYTISTSADNWVYVFDVTGNHEKSTGKHDVDGDQIYVYSPNNTNHDTYGDHAYFKVTSYRYKANNQNYIEQLPWKASHDGTKQYRPIEDFPGRPVSSVHDLTAEEWITDPASLEGVGTVDPKKPEIHPLDFAIHHTLTTWKGDEWMQTNPVRGTEDNPWDLSTSGGNHDRHTANCYVIDRGGWYMLPVVYGNAIENGSSNESSYKFSGTKQTNLSVTVKDNVKITYKYLDVFTDGTGSAISTAYIPTANYKSAQMLWSDVYNVISDVNLFKGSDGKTYVRFKVRAENLQQGNAVIGVFDNENPNATGAKAVWSWHIWFTEHWLNPNNGVSNAFKENTDVFTKFNTAMGGSTKRERGDVQTTKDLGISGYKYHISPYNVGWCDPKYVDYLRRYGTMHFIQYKDKNKNTKTGKEADLPILQEGERVDYKYGSNTYFQFGRKDTFVGFVNHDGDPKRSFGPKQYRKAAQTKSIATGISYPEALFCAATEASTVNNNFKNNDWNDQLYVNLWNNGGTFVMDPSNWNNKSLFNGIKTVYDPCPPGYMVPTAGVWKIAGPDKNGLYSNMDFKDSALPSSVTEEFINGDTAFIIYAGDTKSDKNKIWFTGTGHRWYMNGSVINGITYNGGDNFNPHLAYIWSSTPTGRSDRTGFGLALGKDNTGYGVCTFFYGRRSMARPVRAIRQNYTKP